jgi:hypothetical protein
MAVAAVVALAVMLAAPAVAFGDGFTITPSPVDFGTVVSGQHPQQVVTLTNATADTLRIDAHDSASAVWSIVSATCVDGMSYAPTETCTYTLGWVPTLVGGYSDGFDASGTDTTTSAPFDSSTTVTGTVADALGISSASVTPNKFYPLVQDGYRDRATYTVSLNHAATGTIQVRNHHGRVVKRFPFVGRSSFTATWRGGRDDGTKVNPGTYTFRVVAHDSNGSAVRGGGRSVTVATGFKIVRVHKHKLGTGGTGLGSGSCVIVRNFPRQGVAHADCFGSGSASLTYTFAIPSNARQVRLGMDWRRAGDDVTALGSITITRSVGAHKARIRLTVNGLRAANVLSAGVRYRYRQRI